MEGEEQKSQMRLLFHYRNSNGQVTQPSCPSVICFGAIWKQVVDFWRAYQWFPWVW